jgi:hypothetical protein
LFNADLHSDLQKQLLIPADTFIVINYAFDIQTTKFDSAGKVWSVHRRSTVRRPDIAENPAGGWQNRLVALMARYTAMPAE